jgi:hypothetical protein
MAMDEAQSGLIDLGDMSKLVVIAHLQERGQSDYARGIASDIEATPAKEVANALLSPNGAKLSANDNIVDPAIRDVVNELQASARASVAQPELEAL